MLKPSFIAVVPKRPREFAAGGDLVASVAKEVLDPIVDSAQKHPGARLCHRHFPRRHCIDHAAIARDDGQELPIIRRDKKMLLGLVEDPCPVNAAIGHPTNGQSLGMPWQETCPVRI